MKTLRLILIIFCSIVLIVALFSFIILKWSFISYPPDPSKNNPVVCYSPNHEYYIKRYQTILESIQDHDLNAMGTAIVYDKKGHEVTRGKTALSNMYGPLWSSSGSYGDVGMVEATYNWDARLPSPPVDDRNDGMGCY